MCVRVFEYVYCVCVCYVYACVYVCMRARVYVCKSVYASVRTQACVFNEWITVL